MTDATKTPTDKKAGEPVRDDGELYLFPREGVSIKAKSLEEAQELYHKSLNKESDNG